MGLDLIYFRTLGLARLRGYSSSSINQNSFKSFISGIMGCGGCGRNESSCMEGFMRSIGSVSVCGAVGEVLAVSDFKEF